MKGNNKPLSRKDELIIKELDGELLVYDLKINKAFCLNQTSALIWEMCDGDKSVGEISLELSKRLKTAASEEFVWLAIDNLKKANLISNGQQLFNYFEGTNRRDAIRKIGLASMVALPLVSGIVAPPAINAASAGQTVTRISAGAGDCPTICLLACNNATAQCSGGNSTNPVTDCSPIPTEGGLVQSGCTCTVTCV